MENKQGHSWRGQGNRTAHRLAPALQKGKAGRENGPVNDDHRSFSNNGPDKKKSAQRGLRDWPSI